ncbi:phosphatidate cytidylyltransferase [Aquibaculum sediminis]|uniref:phosphatidate cytidylyltransferase n=1 Tax=Aquibaculum sediminis TaxID=3231907 RepID=UPI003456FF90
MRLPAIDAALGRRIVTAAALAPPVLLAVYLGPPFSDLLLLLLAVGMAWEWSRVCCRGRPFGLSEAALTLLAPAMLLAAMCSGLAAVIVLLLLAPLILLATQRLSPYGDADLSWLLLGLVYVAVPLLVLHGLRGADAQGRDLVLWLLLVIWAADSGAYAFGKTIGGPRLAPRWSPKKTWAGLVGGVACAGLVGSLAASALTVASPWSMLFLGALLAAVGQGGDLLESAFKRRFGVKDASGLIPGHGGLLDRVDALLTAALALALLMWLGVVSL